MPPEANGSANDAAQVPPETAAPRNPFQQFFVQTLEAVGRRLGRTFDEVGFAFSLLIESIYWLLLGWREKQPVRVDAVIGQAMQVGIQAIPIVTLLSFAIGVVLAIQGIYSLRFFGAEDRVTLGIAFSVVREFSPMITGILVAGRSGSALAARLGTMSINQEIDALRVMGISPVRFLVVPALLGMLVMVPALTIWSCMVALMGAGLYVWLDLGMTLPAFFADIFQFLRYNDAFHCFGKSLIFSVLVGLIGVMNGVLVKGGAEGVGQATTRSVVQAISAILVTDMVFVFLVTRG